MTVLLFFFGNELGNSVGVVASVIWTQVAHRSSSWKAPWVHFSKECMCMCWSYAERKNPMRNWSCYHTRQIAKINLADLRATFYANAVVINLQGTRDTMQCLNRQGSSKGYRPQVSQLPHCCERNLIKSLNDPEAWENYDKLFVSWQKLHKWKNWHGNIG